MASESWHPEEIWLAVPCAIELHPNVPYLFLKSNSSPREDVKEHNFNSHSKQKTTSFWKSILCSPGFQNLCILETDGKELYAILAQPTGKSSIIKDQS